jgi:hypothetical protein
LTVSVFHRFAFDVKHFAVFVSPHRQAILGNSVQDQGVSLGKCETLGQRLCKPHGAASDRWIDIHERINSSSSFEASRSSESLERQP